MTDHTPPKPLNITDIQVLAKFNEFYARNLETVIQDYLNHSDAINHDAFYERLKSTTAAEKKYLTNYIRTLVHHNAITPKENLLLGYAYAHGIGVDKDFFKAKTHLLKVAPTNPIALNLLGIMQSDITKRHSYLQQAAHLDFGCALYNLCRHEEDENKVLIQLTTAANYGSRYACKKLQAAKVEEAAEHYLRLGASYGDCDSLYSLAEGLFNQAKQLELDAKQLYGNPARQSELLARQQAAKQTYYLAFTYYQALASRDYVPAFSRLAHLYYKGKGIEANQDIALAYLLEANRLEPTNKETALTLLKWFSKTNDFATTLKVLHAIAPFDEVIPEKYMSKFNHLIKQLRKKTKVDIEGLWDFIESMQKEFSNPEDATDLVKYINKRIIAHMPLTERIDQAIYREDFRSYFGSEQYPLSNRSMQRERRLTFFNAADQHDGIEHDSSEENISDQELGCS